MKISPDTLTLLKNFASINSGMQFKKGNKLSTISTGKNILAKATIADSFTEDFCVYDLNQFLSVYSLKKDPEIEFEENDILFRSSRNTSRYRKTPKHMIVTPPEKDLTLPSVDVSLQMSQEDYHSITDSSKILRSPHISVSSDGDTIYLKAFDAKDDAAHIETIEIGAGNGKVFDIVFLAENFKMIAGTYDVQISFKGLSHFKNTNIDLQYWIASEPKESKIG